MNTETKVTTGATATTHDMIELPPLHIPDLEDELTAVLCAAIRWGGSVISSEEYVAAKQRFRAAVNAAIEADRKRRGSIVNNASASSEPEPCFCDRMYPDSNPDVSCGDCPTRDYKEPMKDSVDIDDFIAAFIARGDITKDAFLEARQWVRDTYYNPAESVNMDLVRKWQAENGVKQDPNSREARMVVIRHDDDGKPTVWCDPEIADLVRALNDGGVETVGSCSGHGWRPGNIMLSDGRVLIICKDVDEAKGVVSHFPCINGEAPLAAEAVGGLSAEQLAEILSAYIKPEIIGEALEKLENAPWELSEPVNPLSDADAKHVQDFINCDGMGAVIVEGPQYSAVVRALLARYK